jgi:glutamate synthase (NADPH/NADH) small chain
MSDPKGFMKFQRIEPRKRATGERVKDWHEFYLPQSEDELRGQATRCMDCGVPFCQSSTGCPVENLIPDWNDLVHQGRWKDALRLLHATNNFPEFTGRLCPAPCESACVLGAPASDELPVTIRVIESSIIERGFDEGWVEPVVPAVKSGRRVAIVGSGPAGLAAAQQLARAGHAVTVFEKSDRIGGLLRYGIPDFKMEKPLIERRLEQLRAEGVEFRTGVSVGAGAARGGATPLAAARLLADFDAVALATGAEQPRDLPVAGRELGGIHFAMDYLIAANREVAGLGASPLSAAGRRVVVIGGGDTGSDCIGTAHRQGAASVHQLELLPQPPLDRASSTPWPFWPMKLRSSHAHEEGGKREWSVSTTHFSGDAGGVRKLHGVHVTLDKSGPVPVAGSAFELETELVLLAMGFTGPVRGGLLDELGVALDTRGNVKVDEAYRTSVSKVFAAGDVKRGASLIVWAIAEGRRMAEAIDRQLAHT